MTTTPGPADLRRPMRPICIVAFCASRLCIYDALAVMLGGSSHLDHLDTESLAVPDMSVISA